MLQCASQYLQSSFVTVSLFNSVGNKTYNYCCCYCYYCYYVYDRGCWHMYIDTTPGSVPSKASSSSCLLAEGQIFPYLTGLQFCTDLCSSDRCWGKCNLVIPMTFYTCWTAVARQYLMLWRRTSTGLPAAHQYLCTARCPWDLKQLELLTEKAPDDSLVIRAWVTGHMHQKESSHLNWPNRA